MTSSEARNLVKQLASSEKDESNAARDALRSFVKQEPWNEERQNVLDTIESGLTQLLSDLDSLEARRETNFAESVIGIVRVMAARAEPAVPVLSKVFLLADPRTSWFAAETLALIAFYNGSSKAVDVLVSGTGTEHQPSLRRHAVQALGLLGMRGVKVQPLLRTLLKDDDTELRKAAIMALSKQREQAFLVVPDLLGMLKQDSELADCLELAVEEITGKPSPISWPRKGCRVRHRGQVAYDDEIFNQGYTISCPGIPGFAIHLDSGKPPEKTEEKTAKKKARRFYNQVPFESALPILAESKKVQKYLRKKWGAGRLRSILEMMKAGKLTGTLGIEVHDLLKDELHNEAKPAWSGSLESNCAVYPVQVMNYEGVYFVWALEDDEVGYFLSVEDAKSYIGFNWWGEVQEDES